MKKIIIFVSFVLFTAFNVFSDSNANLIKVSEIEGTRFSCLYYPTGTQLGLLNAKGDYNILDINKRLLKFKSNRILNRKKYLSTNDTDLKQVYYERFQKNKKAYSQARACKNYKVGKISCEIFTAQESRVKVLNGMSCDSLTSIAAKIFINDTHFCTGTLIAPNAFLTAAHCLVNESGEEDVTNLTVNFMGNTYVATSWHANPKYNTEDETGDTALVFIAKNLSVNPFPLVSKNYEISIGEMGAMIGYGVSSWNPYETGFKGGFSEITKTTSSGVYVKYQNTFGQSNTCSGDSGGPLAVYVDGAWRLLGVTSWGSDNYCGFFSGEEESWWSKINSRENIEFLETYLPNIFS